MVKAMENVLLTEHIYFSKEECGLIGQHSTVTWCAPERGEVRFNFPSLSVF